VAELAAGRLGHDHGTDPGLPVQHAGGHLAAAAAAADALEAALNAGLSAIACLHQAAGADARCPMTAPARLSRRWPLVLIAAPAAVAVWSGWVLMGGRHGRGRCHGSASHARGELGERSAAPDAYCRDDAGGPRRG